MNTKILNNILILTIVIFLISYLSNGPVIETIKKYFSKCKSKLVEKFKPSFSILNANQASTKEISHYSQPDFSYHSHYLDEKKTKKLYDFLQSAVHPNNENYLMIDSSTQGKVVSKKDKDKLLRFLQRKLNCGKHKIKNITLSNKIISYKNQIGHELKPFQIQGKYFYNKKFMGYIVIQYEILFINDESKDVFVSPISLHNDSGKYDITRTFLINLSDKPLVKKSSKILKKRKQPKKEKKAIKHIKPQMLSEEDNMDDMDDMDSLIPDEIAISTDGSFNEGFSSLSSMTG